MLIYQRVDGDGEPGWKFKVFKATIDGYGGYGSHMGSIVDPQHWIIHWLVLMFVHPNCLGALKFRGYSQASVVDVVWLFSFKFWDSEITYIIGLFCFPFEGPWQAMVSPRLCSVHFAGSCRWFLHVCAFVFATIIHHLHCRTPLLSVYPLSSFLSWSPPKFGGVLCGWTHPDMFFLIYFVHSY